MAHIVSVVLMDTRHEVSPGEVPFRPGRTELSARGISSIIRCVAG